MTPQEIIEGNKLIAEFMGGIKEYCLNAEMTAKDRLSYVFMGGQGNWRLDKDCKYQYLPEQLFYYTDWDWLMPVVEKIESINYRNEIVSVQIGMTGINNSNQCTIQAVMYKTQMVGHSKIEAVWLAVVEFIKWKNQQK